MINTKYRSVFVNNRRKRNDIRYDGNLIVKKRKRKRKKRKEL